MLGRELREADVRNDHLAGVEPSRRDGEPDLAAMEGDGEIRVDDRARDHPGGGIDARGEVDCDDLRVRRVDPPDELRGLRARLAAKSRAEERVDDDVVLGLEILGLVDCVARLAERRRCDPPVTAVRPTAADTRETTCGRERKHRLAGDRPPRSLHELGDRVRVAGVTLLRGVHLGRVVERLEHYAGETTQTALASSRECVIERSISPAATLSAYAAVRPESRTLGFGRPTISTSRQVKRMPHPRAFPTASLPANRPRNSPPGRAASRSTPAHRP